MNASMPSDSANENQLLGLLALQLGWLSSADFGRLLADWNQDQRRALGDIALAQGLLQADEVALLSSLVQQQRKRGSHTLAQSLATLGGTSEGAAALQAARAIDPDATLGPLKTVAAESADSEEQAPGRSPRPGSRFRAIRLHARGGLGEVWLAVDEDLGREVALKEIRPRHADQPDSQARFVQEAEITGALEHPGIVPVYALGHHGDGRPFYAMRFIRGNSLQLAIDAFHRASSEEAQRAFRLRQLLGRFVDVCQTIAYAHSRGVLHRDIKPDNIMLGQFGETLVVDWGLAKTQTSASESQPVVESAEHLQPRSGKTPTRVGSAMGTPAYMSPEQARGELDQLGPATDIYSLGATLYCLLTGRPPIAEDSVSSMLDSVQFGRFPRPREIQATIPLPLQSICLHAMALKPEERYSSADELAADVERYLADEAVSAHRDTLADRTARWMRRHKSGVQAGAAALTAIAVIAVASTLLIARSRNRALELAASNAHLAVAEQEARQSAEQRQREAEQATQRALTQQERAERYYRLAIETVDGFLTNVSEDERLKAIGLETLRRDLLSQARDFYELVIEKASEGEDPLLEERADAERRLADINYAIGNHQQAIDSYTNAMKHYRTLAEQDPENHEYLAEFGALANNLALAYAAAGQYANAVSLRRKLVELGQLIVQLDSENADYLGFLALAQLNLGQILSDEDPQESVRLAAQAKQVLGKALELEPSAPGFLDSLAFVHNNLGHVLLELERYDEAEQELRQAESIWRAALDEATGSEADTLRNQLAMTQLNLASLQAARGAADQAREQLEPVIALRRQLAEAHPDVASYQSALADLHRSAGQLYRTLQQYPASESQFQTALAIFQELDRRHPDTPAHRWDICGLHTELGLTYVLLGDYDRSVATLQQALQESEQLTQTRPDNPQYRYTRGLTHYYLGLAFVEQAANHSAVEQLQLAVEGFQALPEPYVSQPQLLSYVADCQETLGQLHGPLLLDQPETAARWWRQTLETTTALLSDPLQEKTPPSLAMQAVQQRASARSGLGDYEAALTDWDAALQRNGGVLDFEVGVGKATTLFYMQRYDAALHLARETAATVQHAAMVHAIARELALGVGAIGQLELPPDRRAQLQEAYAQAALAELQRARELGHFATDESVDFLTQDPYLAPIRERADFQAFLDAVRKSP